MTATCAIVTFSAYASLVYAVTPILAAGLPTACLATAWRLVTGALLMTLGHVVLGLESDSTLEFICGAYHYYLRLRLV